MRLAIGAVLATVFTFLPIDVAFALTPGAVRLQPHLAVYDLALSRAEDRLGLERVNGRLAIEVSGSECEDWTINFRMVSQFQSDDDTTRVIDTQSSTWEAGDGNSINVSQRHFVDSTLDTESKVTASRKDDGRTQGIVEKPKPQQFELANGTIFPVTHLRRLIEAAERGGLRDESIVFDGTEGSKSYTAITFIGHALESGKHTTAYKAGGAAALDKVKAWPTTISYYDMAGGENNEGVPNYQVTLEMFENGVSGDMVMDYGEYVLEAKLSGLELKPVGKCD